MKLLDRSVVPLPLWAKLERSDAETGLGWHSLVDHSADVAACMEALLNLPLVQSRLAALAGVERLPGRLGSAHRRPRLFARPRSIVAIDGSKFKAVNATATASNFATRATTSIRCICTGTVLS